MRARLLSLNLIFRALTGAATERAPTNREKPLTSPTHLEGTAAKMAARQSAQASDRPSHRSCCGQDGRAPTCRGARASTPAEIRSGQSYYLRASTAPVLLHPKKDVKPVPLTSWHCGQDGRAPICAGERLSQSQELLRLRWPRATAQ